jgi:phosphohistidine swiveling domain-containing protein/glycerol-3-phosphate acyltransferase PlsY
MANPIVGAIAIWVLCPLLGALPLVEWITLALTGKRLSQLGTRNISVSAAFYHGGQAVGLLAVLSEALKGIGAVLLAQAFFPTTPAWNVVALIALVLGRYAVSRGAGTTNVVWGFVVHDWVTSLLVFVIGGIGFTLLRERRAGRIGVLVLLVLITALRHPTRPGLVVATLFLSTLMGWIYSQMPDDLDLPTADAQRGSRPVFQFFRGDRALLSLDQRLAASKVGNKAATLAELRQAGYPVPMGWVLPAGDDMAPVLESLVPDADHPLVVRSSATGEDTESASAAGQYESFLNIRSTLALENAIAQCQLSYTSARAVQYRRDRGIPEGAIAVLVQVQVQGAFSGVAFSRDPIVRSGDAVVIEALPGTAQQVVSGRVTPEQYRVYLSSADLEGSQGWQLPEGFSPPVDGQGDVPPGLIQQVAYLARHLERYFHGIPQDIEWSYDGQQLWLLQSRPITTLLPLWTRKIAAEVIPGFIRPLPWSINRPLTCGVWGKLFTLVLGDRARGLDFTETATLHYSAAYFNATLLGNLFRRMGLPPESLEFLTRGAKFSKPPLGSTLRNLPGLLRLMKREFSLYRDFQRHNRQYFQPEIALLQAQDLSALDAPELLDRIDTILSLLERATYYSILAPLSAALRQAVLRVDAAQLDNQATPEVAAVRALQSLADRARPLVPPDLPADALWEHLAQTEAGRAIAHEFQQILDTYGYLSEVGTDISVPTWQEAPAPVQRLFAQLVLNPPPQAASPRRRSGWARRQAQARLNLKGQVTAVYSYLLAALRWTFVELEQRWIAAGRLAAPGDLFFLEFDEIRRQITDPTADEQDWQALVTERRSQFQIHRKLLPPPLVYGNDPPALSQTALSPLQSSQQLTGIGASPGQVEGVVQVVTEFDAEYALTPDTILVVPYTDSGWAPLLVRAKGIIAEVGGQLSHGAIVAREYGIPAVMNVAQATQRLHTGQRVRLDGQGGTVDIL